MPREPDISNQGMEFGEGEGPFLRQRVEEEAVEINCITPDGRLLRTRIQGTWQHSPRVSCIWERFEFRSPSLPLRKAFRASCSAFRDPG